MEFQLKITYFFFLFFILFLLKKFEMNSIYYNNDLNRLYLSKEFNKIYSSLYFTAKNGRTIIPYYNKNYIIKNYNYKNVNGLCLCTLGKKENLYSREFVEYYEQLGFNKIIIFDNNDIEGENFEEVLKDYIQNKFVDIIDIRGISAVQLPTFNYCYQKFQKQFDWIAFFDFDEYLFINDSSKNINKYIYSKKFQNCQSILFNWYLYDDNDLERYDKRKISERFKRAKIESRKVKSMVRGGLDNLLIPTSHILGININYFCDSNGIRVFPKNFYDITFPKNNKAFIKHFYTKTVQEFCNKIKKGDVQFHNKQSNYHHIFIKKLKSFFRINKITKNKIKILEECLNLDYIFLKKY